MYLIANWEPYEGCSVVGATHSEDLAKELCEKIGGVDYCELVVFNTVEDFKPSRTLYWVSHKYDGKEIESDRKAVTYDDVYVTEWFGNTGRSEACGEYGVKTWSCLSFDHAIEIAKKFFEDRKEEMAVRLARVLEIESRTIMEK